MTDETCQERVSNGARSVSFHTCGKPVKEEGLCGVHLAARRRREANDAKRDLEWRQDRKRKDLAQDICNRLAAMGIDADPHFSAGIGARYTGKIVVNNPEALLATIGLINMSA
jgi:hypothetical protein